MEERGHRYHQSVRCRFLFHNFMVASSITVISGKFGEDKAWKWVSDGADGYTIEETEKATPGTDVIMTLKADTEDEKYSEYLERIRDPQP